MSKEILKQVLVKAAEVIINVLVDLLYANPPKPNTTEQK